MEHTTSAPAPGLPPEDFIRLLEALASLPRHRHARSYRTAGLLLRMLYGADVSALELLRADVQDVSCGGGRVTVTRRGRQVTVQLTDDGAAAAVELTRDRKAREPLAPGGARGRLSDDRLRELWARAQAVAGMEHLPLSAIRPSSRP